MTPAQSPYGCRAYYDQAPDVANQLRTFGGWDVYGEFTDNPFNYSTHSGDTAPASDSYQGARVSGALMSYSDYVVFGPHLFGGTNVIGSSYLTGAVGSVVTQMQNVTQATLSASLGSVVATGPAGIPSSGPGTAANENQTVTYSPAGYDPIYGAWNLDAYNNEVNAALTPGTSLPLVHPVFVINNYTSSQLPAALSTGTGASPNYYATVDAANQRLWVTVNGTDSSSISLVAKIKNDFTGTGNTDLLFQNTSSGSLALWALNGATITSKLIIGLEANTAWQIVGTGDFNGDGNIDLLWHNNSTGAVVVWLMNGTTFVSSKVIATVADTDWNIYATGDFNRDGKPDLVWQNSSTGQIVVWLMNGTTHVSTATVGTETNSNWKIVSAADFSGNGNTDLLWQNNSTGAIVVWFLNGTTYTSAQVIGTESNTHWKIVGTGDLNGDGKPDLLWQNNSTNSIVVWYMNDTTFLSSAVIGASPNTNWQIRNK